MPKVLWIRKRWYLLVKDVRGTVIYTEPCWTRRAAEKVGREISTPPLNTYETRKV